MKRKYLALAIALFITMPLAAQKDSFDIATFISPKGWQRVDSNGMVLFHNYKTQNNLTSFCQLFLFPSRPSNNTPERNFQEEWNIRVATPTGSTAKPVIAPTEKSPDGWSVVSGYANITQQGVTYTCMLVAISGFDKVMTVAVNIAGPDYMTDVEKFLSSMDLNSKATARQGSAGGQTNVAGAFDWNNYSFIAPERWTAEKNKDYIRLSQSAQNPEQGCQLTILSPQPSSGNLETDARSIFTQMYPGWQYRYTGEKHHDISKGYTPQGLEYCMMEAAMHKMRPDGYYYDYEDGAVLVIATGKQIVIIAGRHNRLIACFCNHQYEYWRRFFNSFTVKNQTLVKSTDAENSKRIIGDWMALGSTALTEYIFAANGNYQFIGAFGTTSKVTSGYDDYIQIKTSAWKGDGSYVLSGDRITFKKYGKDSEQVKFRFEKVNHGDTGWKERLYMLQRSVADGKEFEVCYEKRSG